MIANSRKITSAVLTLLLVISISTAFVAQIPQGSAEAPRAGLTGAIIPHASAHALTSPDPDPVARSVELTFTVDPSGRVDMEGAVEDTTVTTYPENFTLYEAFSLLGDEAITNVTLVLSPERAVEFPFNATTLSLLQNYTKGGFLDTDFNFTLIFPENMSRYLPPGSPYRSSPPGSSSSTRKSPPFPGRTTPPWPNPRLRRASVMSATEQPTT